MGIISVAMVTLYIVNATQVVHLCKINVISTRASIGSHHNQISTNPSFWPRYGLLATTVVGGGGGGCSFFFKNGFLTCVHG